MMNRVEINGLHFLRWDISDEATQELICWLNENAKKVPEPELGSLPSFELDEEDKDISYLYQNDNPFEYPNEGQ